MWITLQRIARTIRIQELTAVLLTRQIQLIKQKVTKKKIRTKHQRKNKTRINKCKQHHKVLKHNLKQAVKVLREVLRVHLQRRSLLLMTTIR